MPGSNPPTPILGLEQYQGTDDWDYADVNGDNAQIDTLPPTVCLSSARPNTNLYQGRLIYESDTKAVLQYDLTGTPGWRYIKPGNYKTWAHNWSSNGLALSPGSATLNSQFRQIDNHVDFTWSMVRAADTNVGSSGTYTWDLPVAAASFNEFVGMGFYATAGGTNTPCYLFLVNATTLAVNRVSDNARLAWNTIAWTTGDKILFRGSYKAANSNG